MCKHRWELIGSLCREHDWALFECLDCGLVFSNLFTEAYLFDNIFEIGLYNRIKLFPAIKDKT